MKRFLIFFLILGMFSSCDLSELLNKVEVNYWAEFNPSGEAAEATVNYYAPNNEIRSDIIEVSAGNSIEWEYTGIFSEGDQTGFWISTDAKDGYVHSQLIAWYSVLNDLEDYVDVEIWDLPQSENMELLHVLTLTKCYNTSYSVVVEGTNGVPVDIQYAEFDYDSQSLLAETTKSDGEWNYSECFPEGGYASVTVSSTATSGTAKIQIKIDYDDKADVIETLTVDFSTATKSGSLGFPVE